MKPVIGCGAAIINDSKILLIKRVSSEQKYPDQWGFPAGKLEESDASIEESAMREVKEEVNLDFKPSQKLGFYEIHWKDKRMISLIFLGDWSGKVKARKEEISEFGWFSYEETQDLKFAFSFAEAIEDLHKQGIL